MKKIVFVSIFAALLSAGEFDYGNGKFHIKGGFVGLENIKSANIQTFTIKEAHKNIFKSDWFYKYNITWMKSNIINSTISTLNLGYKIYGIDANFIIGRDFFKSKKGFVASGLLLGASFPYIKSKSSSSSLGETKTKIKTFKVGINLNAKTDINKYLSFYISGNYAYQMGKVENKELDASFDVNGNYKSLGISLRFTPFSYKTKIWIFSFSPKLYFTVGYRYEYWKVNDINIKITGYNLGDTSNLKMFTNIGYLGVGYSF